MTRTPRAFTLVIVLLLLAVLSIAVAVQLDAARGHVTEAQRNREEASARSVAETCLDLALAHARGYMESQAPPPADFDPLLDPDGVPGTADDFLPAASSGAGIRNAVVSVPASSTSVYRRYRFHGFDAQETACLVRFDDNSDDASPDMPQQATTDWPTASPLPEGPSADSGRDVLIRDRDRAVSVTVIGLAPVRADVAANDAYDQAHARVTLRRYLETSGGPSIWAYDTISMSSTDALCGLGGATADRLDMFSPSSMCTCGETKLGMAPDIAAVCDYTLSAAPHGQCDRNLRACEPKATAPYEPQEKPSAVIDKNIASWGATDPAMPWLSTTYVDDPVTAATETLGDNGVGELWFRDADAPNPAAGGQPYRLNALNDAGNQGEIYYWDHTPGGLLQQIVVALSVGGMCAFKVDTGTGLRCPTPAELNACETTPAMTGSAFPRPCDWRDNSADAQSLSTWSLTCDATQNESLCWRPMARIDGNANQPLARANALQGTLPLGPLIDPLLQPLLGLVLSSGFAGMSEATRCTDGALSSGVCPGVSIEAVRPISTPALPGVGGGLCALLGAGPCGTLTDTLNTVQSTTWRQYFGGADWTTTSVIAMKSSRFTITSAWTDSTRFADRSVMFFENPADADFVHVEPLTAGTPGTGTWGTPANYIQASLFVQGNFVDERNTSLCAANAACPPRGAAAGQGIRGGLACDQNGQTIGINAFKNIFPLVHARGHCMFTGANNTTGDLMCQTIHATPGAGAASCYVGDLTAIGRCNPAGASCTCNTAQDPTCSAGSPSPNMFPATSACASLTSIDGCKEPGICIDSNASTSTSTTVVGIVFSEGDACLQDHATVYGQVIADNDIALRNNVTINHDGSGAVGAIVTTAAWLQAVR